MNNYVISKDLENLILATIAFDSDVNSFTTLTTEYDVELRNWYNYICSGTLLLITEYKVSIRSILGVWPYVMEDGSCTFMFDIVDFDKDTDICDKVVYTVEQVVIHDHMLKTIGRSILGSLLCLLNLDLQSNLQKLTRRRLSSTVAGRVSFKSK